MTVDVLKEMKKSVIKDFDEYLRQAKKGVTPDITKIINKIIFIEGASGMSNISSKFEKLL